MEAIAVHPQNKKQEKALKALFEAMDIPFEPLNTSKSPYNPAFVKKIKESLEQAKRGEVKKVKTEDLWK